MLYKVTAHVFGRDDFVMFCFCDDAQMATLTCEDVLTDQGIPARSILSIQPTAASKDDRKWIQRAEEERYG